MERPPSTDPPAAEEQATANADQIQSLRDLMPLRTDINFEECDDLFLLAVLQARRFDLDNSFELLCNYFEFRKKNAHLFEDLKASELRYALEDGFPCVLPLNDSHGCRIMVLFPGTWDLETFAIETLMKSIILSLEHLSKIKKVRQNGVLLLVDFSGWTTSHATKLNIGNLRKVIAVFQECSAVWFKNVHLINQPWYINAFITVTKPFMKDHIQDRVVLHGNNMSKLHDYIPQELLPSEFGGNKPEVDQCYWANVLLAADKNGVKKNSTIRIGENPFSMAVDGMLSELQEPGESQCLLSN